MPRARVLVIEDEVDVAATVLELLTARNYEVIAVTTAEEGLEVIPGFRPSVLLLDISLPGLSGPGLLDVFARRYAWLPVIVVTSAVDPEILSRIADGKPFHLVHKPFDLDALDRLVAAAAAGQEDRMSV